MEPAHTQHDRASELLASIRESLIKDDQMEETDKPEPEELIRKYVLPSLQNIKDVMSSLYSPFYLNDQGFSRKIKNQLVRKIANVSRNTIELPLMRQQKFNDNVVLLLEYLLEENLKLKAELQKHSSPRE
jgi:hypothetical protein